MEEKGINEGVKSFFVSSGLASTLSFITYPLMKLDCLSPKKQSFFLRATGGKELREWIWRGHTHHLLRTVPIIGLRFGFMTHISKKYNPNDEWLKSYQCAAGAGFLAALTLLPFEYCIMLWEHNRRRVFYFQFSWSILKESLKQWFFPKRLIRTFYRDYSSFPLIYAVSTSVYFGLSRQLEWGESLSAVQKLIGCFGSTLVTQLLQACIKKCEYSLFRNVKISLLSLVPIPTLFSHSLLLYAYSIYLSPVHH